MDELRNADYRSEYSTDGVITLADGSCIETIVPDSASKLRVTLSDFYAHGDLNGDGVSDAAVILISNSGGSGSSPLTCPAVRMDGSISFVSPASTAWR